MCASQLEWPSEMEFHVDSFEISVVLSQQMELTLDSRTNVHKDETMHKENPIFGETIHLELNKHMTAV